MTGTERQTGRVRREPPRYRRVAVQRIERVGPRLISVTVGGAELDGFAVPEPAASVRLLLPSHGNRALVMPGWDGNEFLLPDGSRPRIRTLTPLRPDATANEVDLAIVVHPGGAASGWAQAARPGDEVALSGPGRGYAPDPAVRDLLLVGDETAIPAIGQLLEAVPREVAVRVLVEVAEPSGRLDLPLRAGAAVQWVDLAAGTSPGDAMVAAVRSAEIGRDTHVWAAGEAAAVQRLRRYLFEERGLPRSQAHVRGYWKSGRSGDADTTRPTATTTPRSGMDQDLD